MQKQLIVDFGSLKYILALIWKASPRKNFQIFAIVALQAVIPLVILYQVKNIFDTVSISLQTSKYHGVNSVYFSVTIIVLLAITNNILANVLGLIKVKHNNAIMELVLEKIHHQSINIDLEYYENAHYYDTFYRAKADATTRVINLFSQIQSIFLNVIALGGLLGLIVSLHWLPGVILFFSIIPGIWVQWKNSRKMFLFQQEATPVQRKAFYYDWLITGDLFVKEIRTLEVGELFKQRSKDLRRKFFFKQYNIIKKNSRKSILAKMIEVISIYTLFTFLIMRTLSGLLTIGSLVLYYQLFNRGQENIRALLSSIVSIFEDQLFLKNLHEFLNYQPKVKNPIDPKEIPKKVNSLEFKNVSFSYPGHLNMTLKNISFKVNKGEIIAIVGKNGSGKTSIIKLLSRLYQPSTGQILFNADDITNFQLKDIRKKISVLFQDYGRYHTSAGENIWLGDIGQLYQEVSINAAAVKGGAYDFISKFSSGLDTTLGKIYKTGEELSMGQWQKIALSRTIFRNADLIILDEPSSSMDAHSERKVFEHLPLYSKDKIVILISHRLNTIKQADCIYFLNNGEIIEQGTHDELMELRGLYANLFNLQSKEFVE